MLLAYLFPPLLSKHRQKAQLLVSFSSVYTEAGLLFSAREKREEKQNDTRTRVGSELKVYEQITLFCVHSR